MGNILDCSSGEKENIEESTYQQPQVESTTGPLVIEEKKHPLQSYIWKLQRSYFESLAKEGPSKKSSSILLSSNCYIARCYASIIMSYVLDWYSDPSHDKTEPIYIFDIGAGLGKLGYLIVFRLFEMKEFWPTNIRLPFVYVLTEMTSSYIAQWEKNPLISQFIQLGYIDYAIFDIEKDHSINLIRSGKSISPLSLKIPPFILCSNVLSYLPQDVLMVEDQHIKQSYLTLLQYTNQSYQYPFQSYDFAWSYEETPDSFPENYTSFLPLLLQQDGKYIIPTTTLTMITTLLSWCNLQGVFLLCDRGLYSQQDQYVVKDPTITTIPAFSLPVNFYILEEYTKQNGGDFKISSFQEEFRCGLFSFNIPKSSLLRTYHSYHTQCEAFTIQSYYSLQKSIQEESLLSFRSIIYLLRLSQHDPSLYYQFKQTITSSYSVLNGSSFDNDLLYDCDHVRDHISSYQKDFDISFELGRLYMGLNDYQTALELFEDSIKYVEPHPVTWYNMGLCSYYMNNLENAKQCFLCALSLNPEYNAAKEKLKLLTGGLNQGEEIHENPLSQDNVEM